MVAACEEDRDAGREGPQRLDLIMHEVVQVVISRRGDVPVQEEEVRMGGVHLCGQGGVVRGLHVDVVEHGEAAFARLAVESAHAVPRALVGAFEDRLAGVGVILEVHAADAVTDDRPGRQAVQPDAVQALEDAPSRKGLELDRPVRQLDIGHAGFLADPQDIDGIFPGPVHPGPLLQRPRRQQQKEYRLQQHTAKLKKNRIGTTKDARRQGKESERSDRGGVGGTFPRMSKTRLQGRPADWQVSLVVPAGIEPAFKV